MRTLFLSTAFLLLLLQSNLAVADDGVSAATLPIAPGRFQPTMDSLKQYTCPQWFRDAKFGIWAHWGPQSVPMDGDWYARGIYEQGSGHYKYHVAHYGHPSKFGYKDIIPLWKAEKWDPERLMQLYKKAGARYFVSMGSHHDNFFLWNSKLHRWNAMNMGPKRDVVGDWQKAAQEERPAVRRLGALRRQLYVVPGKPWRRQDGAVGGHALRRGQPPSTRTSTIFRPSPAIGAGTATIHVGNGSGMPRSKELVDNYHPDLLYSDGGVAFNNTVGLSMIAHLYNSDAARHGGQTEAIYNCKQHSDGRWVEDLERGIMPRIDPHPWQTDTSIGDWFYNRHWKFRPVSWVIDMLVDNVSKNGNLLLNVVPRPDGSIDPEVEQMLEQLAAWTAIHGEAIYGSRPWLVYGESAVKVKGGSFSEDFQYNAREIRFTTKGPTLYAIALGWPADGQLVIRSLAKPAGENINVVTAVSLLGYDGQISWKQTADGLVVDLAQEEGLRVHGRFENHRHGSEAGAPSPCLLPRRRLIGKATCCSMPISAELHGDGIKVEQRGTRSNIGYWDSPGDWASWKADFSRPGVFTISARYALPEGPSEVALEVAGQRLIGKLTATGGWDDFRDMAFGTLNITKAGVQEIKVRPGNVNAWKPVNLRAVKVIRAK